MSTLFVLRLAVGFIFIYHAAPKLRDPKQMASAIGWPYEMMFGLGMIEFMSALALISGVGVKFGALFLMGVMGGAMYYKMKRWHVPFMANNSTGWEFDFLLFAANLTIYLK